MEKENAKLPKSDIIGRSLANSLLKVRKLKTMLVYIIVLSVYSDCELEADDV